MLFSRTVLFTIYSCHKKDVSLNRNKGETYTSAGIRDYTKMKKKSENKILTKVGTAISEWRTEKKGKRKKYTQEELLGYLEKEEGVHISLDTLKSYEQARRSCNIDVFLRIASCLDVDLEKWKEEELEDIKESEELINGWRNCPADIFISIAYNFHLDLNQVKDFF